MHQIFNFSHNEILQKIKILDDEVIKKSFKAESVSQDIPIETIYLNDRRFWTKRISAFFDGSYYLYNYKDLQSWDIAPIIHYLYHGFREGRIASPLIIPNYIAHQLLDTKRPEEVTNDMVIELFSDYESIIEVLKTHDVNPNPFFDVKYFRESNDVEIGSLLPIEFYFRHQGKIPGTEQQLETTPLFSLQQYASLNQDVIKAGYSPLEHLVAYGINEGRLSKQKGVVNQDFIKNTYSLYKPKDTDPITFFIKHLDPAKHIAGPNWKVRSMGKLPHYSSVSLSNSKRVTIGVVLYNNSAQELKRLYSSIQREIRYASGIHCEVVFWNNSPSNSNMIENIIPSHEVLNNDEGNLGFGRAHNVLMEYAFDKSDYYIALNPDGYLLRDSIPEVLRFSQYNNDNALVELSSFPIEHPKWYDPIEFCTQWVSGAAFLMPKKIWSGIGGFDPEIHMYCEDVDLSWRAKAAGFELKVCPSARFFHDVTPRFVDEDAIIKEQSRAEMMYKGAYFLCEKWGGKEMAAELLTTLEHDFNLSYADIPKPKNYVSKELASKVVDFEHGLRFSPSRFWK